jgi:hypothetical protein
MSKVILSSIDDLKEEFLSKKGKPYFTVYNGHNKETKNVYHRSDEHSDMDSAWEELEGRAKKFEKNGGDFTVYCAAKEGATNGDTIYIRLDKGDKSSTAIAGFNYIGGVDTYIDHRLKIAELERKLEEGEAVPNAPNIQDRVFGLIEKSIESDEGGGKMFLGGLLSLGHRFAAIGEKWAGIETMPVKKKAKPNEAKVQAQAQSDDEGYDPDTLVKACNIIEDVVPNEKAETVILKVAEFLKKNPHMVDSFKQMTNG